MNDEQAPLSMAEQEVDAHNRVEAWRDVLGHLDAAHHSLEQAMGAFDDVEVYERVGHISENLKPHLEAVERFKAIAEQKVADS